MQFTGMGYDAANFTKSTHISNYFSMSMYFHMWARKVSLSFMGQNSQQTKMTVIYLVTEGRPIKNIKRLHYCNKLLHCFRLNLWHIIGYV